MATPHIRYQLHLHGAQIMRVAALVLVVLLLPATAAWAQRKVGEPSRNKKGGVKSITVKNMPDYDSRWFHPGMYVALTASRFDIEQSTAYTTNQTVTANSIISPSLGVGFIGDAR